MRLRLSEHGELRVHVIKSSIEVTMVIVQGRELLSGTENAIAIVTRQSDCLIKVCFRTGPLQSLCEVPQHLMYLTITYDRSHV